MPFSKFIRGNVNTRAENARGLGLSERQRTELWRPLWTQAQNEGLNPANFGGPGVADLTLEGRFRNAPNRGNPGRSPQIAGPVLDSKGFRQASREAPSMNLWDPDDWESIAYDMGRQGRSWQEFRDLFENENGNDLDFEPYEKVAEIFQIWDQGASDAESGFGFRN